MTEEPSPGGAPEKRRTPRRVLWLGAHKTGTTYLQGMLDASRPNIRPKGVAYETLEVFRDRYTRPLLGQPPQAEPAPGSDFALGEHQTIVFDENIPGLVQNAIRPGRGLYPRMEARVTRVIEHLGFEPDAILVGIRDLAGFLPSLYCEMLKSTSYRPFGEFMKGVPPDLSWYAYLARIADLFPNCRVFVYSTSELRGRERALLSWLTGLPPSDFVQVEGHDRPGFSQDAVDALDRLARDNEVTQADVFRVVRQFPKSEEHRGFAPFSEQETEDFGTRFLQDISRIRKDPRMRRPLRSASGKIG